MLFDQRETYPDQDETYPDQDEAYSEPDTYWRRRAATLAAGLGVLGLLAWAFSSGGGTPASHNAATSASTAAGTSGPMSLPAGASAGAGANASPATSASAGGDPAVPGLARPGTSGLPSATSSPARKPAKSAKSAKSPKQAKSAKQAKSTASPRSTAAASTTRTARSTEPGGRCAPGSVVLSLFGGSRDYPGGQEPTFGVDVVSTAPGTCTMDLGPTQFHLVVMSAGRVIWDSADCARADGTRLARLTRGVPVQRSFTWNRAITLPGCVTLASSARAGSYTAQARTGSASSQVYTFKLVHLIPRTMLPAPRPAPAGCPRPQPPR
jgi:hypothetical protein